MGGSTTWKQRTQSRQKQNLPCPQYPSGNLQFSLETEKSVSPLHLWGIVRHPGALDHFEKVMTQVGRFRGSAFVYSKKKGLCGPSVLPGVSEERHLSPNWEELILCCVASFFISTTTKNKSSAFSGWSEHRVSTSRLNSLQSYVLQHTCSQSSGSILVQQRTQMMSSHVPQTCQLSAGLLGHGLISGNIWNQLKHSLISQIGSKKYS